MYKSFTKQKQNGMSFKVGDKVQYKDSVVRDIYFGSADNERRLFGYDIIEVDDERKELKVIVNVEKDRFAWWSFDAIEHMSDDHHIAFNQVDFIGCANLGR